MYFPSPPSNVNFKSPRILSVVEKLTVAKLASKLPPFIKIGRSLSCPHEPTSGPYSETDACSIHLTTNTICLCMPVTIEYSLPFPSGFPTKIRCTLLINTVRATYTVHLIILDLMILIFNEE